MQFFIKIYLKLINNFWKIVILKLIRSLFLSIDFAPAINVCINMFNDIDLLNLNCLITMIVAGATTYVYYILYMDHNDKRVEAVTKLKATYSELVLYNLYSDDGGNDAGTRLNFLVRIKRCEKYVRIYKKYVDIDLTTIFAHWVLAGTAFVGFTITYDPEKLVKAYNLTKTWCRSWRLRDSSLGIGYHKLFKIPYGGKSH